MTTCSPSYEHEFLPVDPNLCANPCAGVTFSVTTMVTSMTKDGCEFKWTVKRDKTVGGVTTSTNFSDEAVVGCPGTQEVLFYCDSSKACAIFKLILRCVEVEPPQTT